MIRFQPSPNAPVLKQKFYKITASNKFQAVIAFLRKELGWKPSDSLVRTLSGAGPAGVLGTSYLLATSTHRRFSLPCLRCVQFCYINAAFSPAPDDTVGNLYKVGQL